MIDHSGVYSSSEIQLGGAPMVGATASSFAPGLTDPLAAPAPVFAPTQRSLITASQAAGLDFCPICEACRGGLCPTEVAAA